jgi:hypothetical protein
VSQCTECCPGKTRLRRAKLARRIPRETLKGLVATCRYLPPDSEDAAPLALRITPTAITIGAPIGVSAARSLGDGRGAHSRPTAPPSDIWPWLVQIGSQRGGLHSYDYLDRLFGSLERPSASRILPEFQNLSVGDRIEWGREYLTVAALDPIAR